MPMAHGVDATRMSLEQRWSESAVIDLRASCSRVRWLIGSSVGVTTLERSTGRRGGFADQKQRGGGVEECGGAIGEEQGGGRHGFL